MLRLLYSATTYNNGASCTYFTLCEHTSVMPWAFEQKFFAALKINKYTHTHIRLHKHQQRKKVNIVESQRMILYYSWNWFVVLANRILQRTNCQFCCFTKTCQNASLLEIFVLDDEIYGNKDKMKPEENIVWFLFLLFFSLFFWLLCC